jgi:hypothetical protein
VGKAASAPLPHPAYKEEVCKEGVYKEALPAACASLHADYHDPTSNYNARLGYGTDQARGSSSSSSSSTDQARGEG